MIDIKYVKEDKLSDAIKNMSPGISLTEGQFTFEIESDLCDMEWNHMDQMHRKYIHRTYEESIRLVTGQNFALSLTKWGRWPFFITVTDVRVEEGLYYQCMTLAGLIYIHLTIDMSQQDKMTKTVITWRIASHWMLKLLHPILSRKFYKLNQRLQVEDEQIRVRRRELRKKGFSFKTDKPDYINSNHTGVNTIPPIARKSYSIPFGTISSDKTVITFDAYEFIVQKTNDSSYLIWPGVCPHEGGILSMGTLCDDKIACPWHGLKFSAIQLNEQNPVGVRYGYRYTLMEDCIAVTTELNNVEVLCTTEVR